MPCTNARHLIVPLILFLAAFSTARSADQPKPDHPFRSNVKVEVTDAYFIVRSDGIPDHDTGHFPNRTNPNTIQKQDYTFKIPRVPTKSDTITKLPMGPIGVAINGVPFYNPYNR